MITIEKQQAGVDLKPFFLLYVVSGFVFSTDHSNSNLLQENVNWRMISH